MSVADLPPSIFESNVDAPSFEGPVRTLEDLNHHYARWALARCDGRKGTTAESLDIDRKALSRLLGESSPSARD